MANEQVIWIDADGGQLNLNDWVNYLCTRERLGMWSPPYTLNSSKLALAEGSQFNNVLVGDRGVDLPLKIKAKDRDTLRTLLRDLSHRMNPKRGEGQLKIINGSYTRILHCYPEGLNNDITDKGQIAELILSFTAYDPYWYSDITTSITIQNVSSSIFNFFSDSYFPMRLINSTTYAVRTISNLGQEDTYPIWSITGPGDSIILRNLKTNKTISLPGLVLLEGQLLIIDTRTGIKTITVDGENKFSFLNKLSSLWSVVSGDNDIVFQMANSNINSKIQMDFTERYQSP